MSDQEFLFHCAPTLANVKIGNLFTLHTGDSGDLRRWLLEKSRILRGKGVHIRLLKLEGRRCLVYVYRKKQLEKVLSTPEVQRFLREFQYEKFGLGEALASLSKHLDQQEFPHEIGVFLGYPLEDIQGFITHRGKNFQHTGCWKVYHNPEKALKTFAKYKKCVKIYLEKHEQGFDMSRLVVAS